MWERARWGLGGDKLDGEVGVECGLGFRVWFGLDGRCIDL